MPVLLLRAVATGNDSSAVITAVATTMCAQLRHCAAVSCSPRISDQDVTNLGILKSQAASKNKIIYYYYMQSIGWPLTIRARKHSLQLYLYTSCVLLCDDTLHLRVRCSIAP